MQNSNSNCSSHFFIEKFQEIQPNLLLSFSNDRPSFFNRSDPNLIANPQLTEYETNFDDDDENEKNDCTIQKQNDQINLLKNENSILRKENKSLSLYNCRLQKSISDLRKRTNLIILNKSRQIAQLKDILKKNEDSDIQINQNPVYGPLDLTETFIANLVSNCSIVSCRRRYFECIYNLSYVLYLHSNITYKILRTIIPLPSEQMLKIKFDSQLKAEKDNLLDSNQIEILLNEFKKELTDSKDVFATLAYDAATLDPGKSNCCNLNWFIYIRVHQAKRIKQKKIS